MDLEKWAAIGAALAMVWSGFWARRSSIEADRFMRERKLLQERAWYVSESHRGSRVGVKLWQAWDQDCNQYLESGRVQAVLLSTQGSSTNFDPGRRGWRLIEQTWMKEQ